MIGSRSRTTQLRAGTTAIFTSPDSVALSRQLLPVTVIQDLGITFQLTKKIHFTYSCGQSNMTNFMDEFSAVPGTSGLHFKC